MSFQLPTVTIRKGKHTLKVNQADWATDLGRFIFKGYSLVSETRVSKEDEEAAKGTQTLMQEQAGKDAKEATDAAAKEAMLKANREGALAQEERKNVQQDEEKPQGEGDKKVAAPKRGSSARPSNA